MQSFIYKIIKTKTGKEGSINYSTEIHDEIREYDVIGLPCVFLKDILKLNQEEVAKKNLKKFKKIALKKFKRALNEAIDEIEKKVDGFNITTSHAKLSDFDEKDLLYFS